MARTPFSLAIPSGVKRETTTSTFNSTIADGRSASEAASGTNRHKPTGWLDPAPYTFSRTRLDRAHGYHKTYQETNPAYKQFVTGCIGSTAGSTPGVGLWNSTNHFNTLMSEPSHSASYRDQAIVKARLAMKDQSVNLGVAFAERNATARMLGNNATAIAQAFMALKRGNVREAMRKLRMSRKRDPRGKSVTQKWLELQYGWEPLLADVYGASEALAKRQKSDWCVTGKGSVRHNIEIDRQVGSSTTDQYWRGEVRGWQGCFVRIDAIPQNDLLQSFAALGITNPALVGWELLPLSFIVDWALPIGDYLNSLDAMLGFGPTKCSISEFWTASWVGRGLPQVYKRNAPYYTEQDWSERKHRVELRRTVSNSVPLPTLPRFKDPRSLDHMANGLALLAQTFGR